MIIVSGRRPHDPLGGDYAVNYSNAEGAWYRMRTPIRYENPNSPGYSRSMTVAANGKELYTVVNLANGEASRLNMTFFRIPLELAFGWSYELTANCSFKLMTIDGEAKNIVQQTHQNNDSQKWALADAGEGYCRLIASDGKVLGVENASTADGAKVVLADRADRDSQKWQIRYLSEGFYKLIAKHSNKALSVSGGANSDGAVIQQGPADGSSAMKWRIEAVDAEDAWGDWKWVPNVY